MKPLCLLLLLGATSHDTRNWLVPGLIRTELKASIPTGVSRVYVLAVRLEDTEPRPASSRPQTDRSGQLAELIERSRRAEMPSDVVQDRRNRLGQWKRLQSLIVSPGRLADRIVYRSSSGWIALTDANQDGHFSAQERSVVENFDTHQASQFPASSPESDAAETPPQPKPTSSVAKWYGFLESIDGTDRKAHLTEVVEACDFILTQLGEAAATKRRAELLYRKGRALAYMELPDVIEHSPIRNAVEHEREFQETFTRLDELVDTTSRRYFLLHIRYERRRTNYGTALRVLNDKIVEGPPTYLLHKKRRDLLGLLGWRELWDLEDTWLKWKFPAQYQPADWEMLQTERQSRVRRRRTDGGLHRDDRVRCRNFDRGESYSWQNRRSCRVNPASKVDHQRGSPAAKARKTSPDVQETWMCLTARI